MTSPSAVSTIPLPACASASATGSEPSKTAVLLPLSTSSSSSLSAPVSTRTATRSALVWSRSSSSSTTLIARVSGGTTCCGRTCKAASAPTIPSAPWTTVCPGVPSLKITCSSTSGVEPARRQSAASKWISARMPAPLKAVPLLAMAIFRVSISVALPTALCATRVQSAPARGPVFTTAAPPSKSPL